MTAAATGHAGTRRSRTTGQDPALELRDVVKTFGSVRALDAVGCTVRPGTVHGLLGRNGAGKTTLLRCVLGLVRPDSGEIAGTGRGAVAGFVESPRFYPYLNAVRNLDLLAALDAGGGPSVADVLDVVGIDASTRRRKVGTYSTGTVQRLGIAAALLRDPRLLVLDEPTNGLDPAGIADLRELVASLAAEGRTVLLSTHDMAEVEQLCDALTVLRRGRTVYDGTLADLRDAAPAPAYRLVTSDDDAAAELLDCERAVDGFVLRAHHEVMDTYVLALGRAGIAVRTLVRRDTSLEAMFVRLTRDADD